LNRHERAFRRLVRLYPSSFRAEYEDQMLGLFADQLRDSRTSDSPFALTRLWVHTLIDLMATAPQQHLRKDAPMLQPVESPDTSVTVARSPLLPGASIIATVPMILWAALAAFAPGFVDPVFMNPPAMLGLPAGVVIIAFAMAIAFLGLLLVRRARTVGVVLGTLVFLTIPALLLLLLAPALILVVANLAGAT
jgi:hypothetical protein